MATVVLGDNSYGSLGSSLASTASAITFTAGHGARFPAVAAGEVLYACILNSNNVLEEIQITTHTSSADTADVVRAIGGTTAKAWNSGDRIEVRLSSTAIRNLFADPLAVTGTATSEVAGPISAARGVVLPEGIAPYGIASTNFTRGLRFNSVSASTATDTPVFTIAIGLVVVRDATNSGCAVCVSDSVGGGLLIIQQIGSAFTTSTTIGATEIQLKKNTHELVVRAGASRHNATVDAIVLGN